MAHRSEEVPQRSLARSLRPIAAELLRRCGVRVFHVFRRPHHGVSQPHAAGSALVVRIVEWHELPELSHDPDLGLDEEFLAAARSRGDLCVGAFDDGELVAYVWRAFEAMPAEDGFWVRFDPPNRYGYKAFTRPSHRGLRLQSALAPTTDRLLLERGYTHAISYAEHDNYASIASALAHGNVHVGYAGWIDLWGLRRCFSSRGAREHGFEFFDPL